MKVYKLTDKSMQTCGKFQWKLGVPATASGEGNLCGPGWLHWYPDPLLAILMNPMAEHHQVKSNNLRMFEAEAQGETRLDYGYRGGSTELVLVRELTGDEIPKPTDLQCATFGVLCAKATNLYPGPWFRDWLSGEDRSAASAQEVKAKCERIKCDWGRCAAAGVLRVAKGEHPHEHAWAAHYASFYAAKNQYRPFDLAELARQAISA